MNTIEKSIVVDVPVRTAYNQWTQFESFPQFMEGVESVQQQGDKSHALARQHRGQNRRVGCRDHRADA